MKKILTVMILILTVVLVACAGYLWQSSRKENKKQFQKSQEVFGNPLMGYAPSAWHDEISEDVSLLYMDITWAELEPEEGVYAWDTIEAENQIKRWREEGKHLILRFVCDIPGDEKHMDIPQWLYEKTGEDGTWYNGEYGKGYSPDYNNKILMEAHEKAIRALGEHFGKDGLISYIELGSLGHWGEWHVNYKEGITRIPKETVRNQYVTPWLEAFPGVFMLMRRPFHIAEDYGMGLYNDMAGESDSFASILKEEGYAPECVLKGIGEYPAVRQVYLSHLQKAVTQLEYIPDEQSGILYGIGVGTGNPKQMTLQELEVIRECDLIVIPAVSKEECYAYRIAEQAYHEISEKPVLCMPFPMIKDEGKLEISHNKIYENIEGYLSKGQKVGMLTIGDPSIYSTYMYMHKRAEANGWRAQIISGVPSFCSVAARLGISLGEKNEEIHIIPSAYKPEDTFSYDGTCVYMKSGKGLKALISALRLRQETTGESYEINAVSNCGMDNEKIYHGLDELEEAQGYLTTVIVKKKNNCISSNNME